MMDVKYSPGVKLLPTALQESLQMVSAQLAGVIGPQASPMVTAEWDYSRDFRGRDLYRLSIEDHNGRVSTEFAASELANPTHLSVRLYRIWGDLLQIRSDLQMKVIDSLIPELAAD